MDEKKCEENMLKRREMFVNTDENYWSYKGFVFFIVSYFVVPFFTHSYALCLSWVVCSSITAMLFSSETIWFVCIRYLFVFYD